MSCNIVYGILEVCLTLDSIIRCQPFSLFICQKLRYLGCDSSWFSDLVCALEMNMIPHNKSYYFSSLSRLFCGWRKDGELLCSCI